MNIFSKLFLSSSIQKPLLSHDTAMTSLQAQFKNDVQFYTRVPLFFQGRKKTLEYMMLHPRLGLALFHFFDYGLSELKDVIASVAKEEDTDADIQVQDDKDFLKLRCDSKDIHSFFICTQLSEEDFDKLDISFHTLMPKNLTLFKDALDYEEKILEDSSKEIDLEKLKQAVFPEFIVPQTQTLMSSEQQEVMHLQLRESLHIHGLPGAGKSSLLIAKSLYEKMKNPQLRLIIFAPRSCHVHFLQAMIFQFIENSQWGLNPADITVSNFESIQKRSREKEKYDLIVCDDINAADLSDLKSLLKRDGYLLSASHYDIKELFTYALSESFRLSPALCAACEGLEIETLEENLVFEHGNIFMKTFVILEKLLKSVPARDISIVHYDTQQRRELQTHINEYFTPISYLYDDVDKKEGIVLYPLSQMTCLNTPYIIIIIDEESKYDPIEFISRAGKKSFILGESEAIYNTITQIKGLHNEIN